MASPGDNGGAVTETSSVGLMSTTRAVLDLDRDSQPISGRLWPPGGDPPLVFTGWIQFAAVIDALRRGDADAGRVVPRPNPTTGADDGLEPDGFERHPPSDSREEQQ